jgi:hypothetical protein
MIPTGANSGERVIVALGVHDGGYGRYIRSSSMRFTMVANRSLMPRICPSASAETVSGSCSSRIRGHLLAVGGELGQNVARGWCPAEDPVGVGGG